jgi:hypothetical protein
MTVADAVGSRELYIGEGHVRTENPAPRVGSSWGTFQLRLEEVAGSVLGANGGGWTGAPECLQTIGDLAR